MGPRKRDSPSPMTHFLKASSTISPDPGLESHRRHESFQKGANVFPWFLLIRLSDTGCFVVALTLLLFLCRLLLSCSTHSPDLWLWHTPRSWDKDCSLQPGPEPETGGCPPERDPGDTEQTCVCMTESCLYEGTVACQCSTWCNTMLFMGSCDGNRGISCSKVVFWSTTATRWSSPRSAHTKLKNVAKLSCLVFYFCPFNPSPYLFRGATVPPCGPSASQPAWCM